MAKAEAEPVAAPKGGMKGMLVIVAVGLIAAAAGFALPRFLPGSVAGMGKASSEHEEKSPTGLKLGFVPFDQVVVNVNEQRLARFLRVKLIIVVDAADEKQIGDLVTKNKAILKNWLISHLSDKGMQDVSGAVGINRARREIQDQFNYLLCPDGSEKVRDILFEEFNVQ
jgi:flagellar FliL protein